MIAGEHCIRIDHWGDQTERDNVKFWAGASGYPGAALARDALSQMKALGDNPLAAAAADPFAVSGPQSSSFRFDWRRDYVEKLREHQELGIAEYWIFDRFRRTLTVYRGAPDKPVEVVVREGEVYRTPLLPGFELPMARVLAAAERWQ